MDNINQLTCQLIDEILKQLEEYGWCQGQIMNADDELCMLGARERAARELFGFTYEASRPTAHRAMVQTVICHFIDKFRQVTGSTDIPRYNDDPGTTYEDVVLTLKQMRELVSDDG